ncbi:MAG: hypothetical protein QME46_01095 [Thermoanaerobacteraceae bacterium]|nr:hypothetical protein [Thermoanaerobacteraceae bacterium]
MDELGFEYIMDNLEVLTPGGHRLKRAMAPFEPGQEDDVRQCLSLTGLLLSRDDRWRRELAYYLSSLKDITGSLDRAQKGLPLKEVELFELKNDLFTFEKIYNTIRDIELPEEYIVKPVPEVYNLLNIEGEASSFFIYSSYSSRLKEIRKEMDRLKKTMDRIMADRIEELKESTGLEISPDGRAYIGKGEPIPNGFYLLKEGLTRATISANPSDEYIKTEKELIVLKNMEEEEELKVREHLTDEVLKHMDEIQHSLKAASHIDLLLARANLAVKLGLNPPEITDNMFVHIKDGFHPYIKSFLEERCMKYQPVSITLEKGVTVLTGANMGGKSVTLKMVGLIAKMASYGLYVPAAHAEVPIFSYIYLSREGDSPENGLSSFGNAMAGLSPYLKKDRGLLLLDELTQGTNPPEGRALLLSIIEYLKDMDTVTLITTHYEGVNVEGIGHYRVRGLKDMSLEEIEKLSLEDRLKKIRQYMDYSLENVGYSDVPQDAINIAYLMGIDFSIIERARQIQAGLTERVSDGTKDG